ncbi:unnamed protein product, partial [Mycena citricolor]
MRNDLQGCAPPRSCDTPNTEHRPEATLTHFSSATWSHQWGRSTSPYVTMMRIGAVPEVRVCKRKVKRQSTNLTVQSALSTDVFRVRTLIAWTANCQFWTQFRRLLVPIQFTHSSTKQISLLLDSSTTTQQFLFNTCVLPNRTELSNSDLTELSGVLVKPGHSISLCHLVKYDLGGLARHRNVVPEESA